MIRETLLVECLRRRTGVAARHHFGSKCWDVKGITFAAAVRFGSNDLLLLQASMHELEDARPYCHLEICTKRNIGRPHANSRPTLGVIQASPLFTCVQTVQRFLQLQVSSLRQGSALTRRIR